MSRTSFQVAPRSVERQSAGCPGFFSPAQSVDGFARSISNHSIDRPTSSVDGSVQVAPPSSLRQSPPFQTSAYIRAGSEGSRAMS